MSPRPRLRINGQTVDPKRSPHPNSLALPINAPSEEQMQIEEFTLEAVDVDGAIRETGEEAAGDSRAAFFRKAGLAAGGMLMATSVFAGLPSLASAAVPKGDIAILKYALTLEYLEAAFYKEAVNSGKLSGEALAFAQVVSRDEAAHVAGLKKALGSKAQKSPKFDFQGTTKDQAKFLATAYTLENTGVKAYLGQAGRIKTPAILQTAASIVTIEARHSGAVGQILGKSISPSGAYDVGASMSAILKAVQGTRFIAS
jgi:rubrerythrin